MGEGHRVGRRLLLLLCAALITPVYAGTTNYTYDELGRLRTVTAPDGSQTSYTFDPTGNRQSITGPSTPPPPITAPGSLSGFSPIRGVVNLVWTASTGGTPPYTYYVEYCSGSSCTNFVFLKTSTVTNTQVTGLVYPATYRFRVRARDAGGAGAYGPYSNIFPVTTQ
jgi:YD repeat-containing protein